MKMILRGIADVVESVAEKISNVVSIGGYYQPVEPESVRKVAEEHRQAKLARKMAKKNVK